MPLIFSTTNGTRAILTAASSCERVFLGSLLNLDAVAAAARESGEDVVDRLRGVQRSVRARRRVLRQADRPAARGRRTDAAKASELIARSFPNAYEGL